jgi:hypothetical protein
MWLPLVMAAVFSCAQEARSQNGAPPPAGRPQANAAPRNGFNAAVLPGANALVPGVGPAGVGVGNGSGNNGAQGGSAMADFDSLMDLITSTIDKDSWEENGTGSGQISPFRTNGVYVDAAGALRLRPGAGPGTMAAVRQGGMRSAASVAASTGNATAPATADLRQAARGASESSARTASPMRYVSLPRLEAAIADCQRRHVKLQPEMLTLAGLQRVNYVLVYPETHDLVLAGPAGDWRAAPGGGIVSVETNRPVVRLDDLMALWRRQRAEKSAAFGCSIVPRQEALARTQAFLAESAAHPLEPSERTSWLKQLRDTVGLQDVQYFHVDPDTRIGALLLAADYHMKLIGMGLAPGVPGVRSYLSTVKLDSKGQAPPMAVLRWWFSMPTSTVEAATDHSAFAMPARCVQVLSENELLAARGEQVHTGQSEDLNRLFAESFTKYFEPLADKYPVYGELQRVFELALSLALVDREGLAEKVGWSPSLFVDGQRLGLPKVKSPRSVETVINHRVIGGTQIIAGVSGGVWVDGGKSLAITPTSATSAGRLTTVRKAVVEEPENLKWWWD